MLPERNYKLTAGTTAQSSMSLCFNARRLHCVLDIALPYPVAASSLGTDVELFLDRRLTGEG